jgi:hypothetical protein
MRLRVEPLPTYEQSAMASPGVPHLWPDSETYLGWIELAVRDEAIVSELVAGAAACNLAEKITTIHTYPVREIYTIISAGWPTEVGLRGYPAMQIINSVGAENQRSEPVLNMLYGDAVRGLDQLRRA